MKIIKNPLFGSGTKNQVSSACLLAEERSLGSRNATQITASDWGKAVDYLLAQWSPVQIANQDGC